VLWVLPLRFGHSFSFLDELEKAQTGEHKYPCTNSTARSAYGYRRGSSRRADASAFGPAQFQSTGIANGDIAKKIGWDIELRRFNSGAEIFAAIASGDVQIGDVGSSPFAAAVSQGLDVRAFYISSFSRDGEALVVRPDIASPADLRGKKLAAAPVSTDHYQLLAVLKQEGITEKESQVIAIENSCLILRPADVASRRLPSICY
jgi:ABC-type amino acid transport substrate-binding protein